MSMFQELEYTNDIKKVSAVQFSLMSPDEIRRRSVAEIYTNETYDGDIPKTGGLFDPRMGVLDHGKKCPTDELDNRYCPGYFGHISLAKPVFYLHFMKHVTKTLQSVCWRCSKLLISKDKSEMCKIINSKTGCNRFTAVTALCNKISKKRCGDKNIDGCGAIQPSTIKKETNTLGKITAIWKSKSEEKEMSVIWDADDVLKIFKRISIEDMTILGFNPDHCRPEWLICQVLPVAPPSVRPSVKADNNTRMEDDITHKYCDIIKTNKTLENKLNNSSNYGKITKKAIDEWYQLLQYHVATLVNNSLPGIPPAQQRSGRPLKAIFDRLKSKEGRVRGNLMGKRVDKSARSVITPDPRLKINELGVPIDICKNLTYPEKVNNFNKEKLIRLVRNGYHNYPGAKSIKKKSTGKIISLSVIDTSQIELENGDIVNRHLIKGDKVLFNRQPSLHKMSMMQHEVVPLPFKTFRLNVSVTTPYNADFDGDEMNMHVPQSEQTRIELKELASVESQIITPAQHKPIISLVQDTCIGSYLFTRYDNFLTKDEILDIMIDIKSFNGILPDPEIKKGTKIKELNKIYPNFPEYKYEVPTTEDLWSGRQILSLILPNINLRKSNKSHEHFENNNSKNGKKMQNQNMVEIYNGSVKAGVFDKNLVGSSASGLIHTIFNEYGKDIAQNFLDDMQNIITNWVLKSGFSVGISDLVPNKEIVDEISKKISDKNKKAQKIIDEVHQGILESSSGKPISEEFEMQMMSTLSGTEGQLGKYTLKSLKSDNRMRNIILSGSKGKVENMGQMVACVGQQAVDSKRIPYGFTDRTLPHFHKYDDGPAARGFVENSFMKGLTPTEFFFHAMGGREGLIDTAVKTSETGYIQRKLVKAMEDARIVGDFSVRNANNSIIQFIYGEDGLDGACVESQKIEIFIDDDKLKKKFEINDKFLENYTKNEKEEIEKLNNNLTNKIIQFRDYYFNRIYHGNIIDNEVVCPVNFYRLLTNTSRNLPYKKRYDNNINILEVFEKLELIEKEIFITDEHKANQVMILLSLIHLCPKNLFDKKISKEGFEYMINNIKTYFKKAIAHPGELVGTISAQSIGEPSTQMTLNTFHLAGIAAGATVNQGVPRFKELLSVSKSLKTPSNKIVLNEPNCFMKEQSQKVLNEITITSIKNITIMTEIFFDNGKNEIDKELTELFDEFDEMDNVDNNTISPWVLRMEFDKVKMMDKNIEMMDIYWAIYNKFNSEELNNIKCIISDDNAEKLVVRIQSIILENEQNIDSDEEDMISVLKTLEKTILKEIVLKGVSDIKSGYMQKENDYYQFDKENGKFNKKDRWVIHTNGTNLEDIIIKPGVNPYLCSSNDIHEIYRLLGIEAARQVLINEITSVFNNAGSYINYRHISLLVDIITNRGALMSVDRHGINKSDRGPLAKCSFEETPDILARAAIFGELDKMRSVSSNIMLGQEAPIGTASIDILFDEKEFFKNAIDMSEEIKERDEEITEEFKEAYAEELF